MINKLTNQEEIEQAAQRLIYKMYTEGKTLQEAAGISEELLEEIYCMAYAYYNQGKYKEALSLFQFLVGICPKVYKYTLGLAASFHQLERYEDATLGFYLALTLNIEDPTPAYYAADCCLKNNDKEGAHDFLSLAIEIAEANPQHANLKEKCELIRKSLN